MLFFGHINLYFDYDFVNIIIDLFNEDVVLFIIPEDSLKVNNYKYKV